MPLLATGSDLILEGNFRPGEHEKPLLSLPPAHLAQVLCRVDENERLARLTRRRNNPQRHAGHRDGDWVTATGAGAGGFLALPGEQFILADSGRHETTTRIDQWWNGLKE